MPEGVIAVSRQAGEILMKHFHSNYRVMFKNDNRSSPVTIADQEADACIRAELRILFPQDKILSEESDEIPVDFSGRVWMVDPLDGTNEYTRQHSGFSVSIGLCVDGQPILGVVYNPARKELFYAEKGKGAFVENRDGRQRLRVRDVGRLRDAHLVTRVKSGGVRLLDAFVDSLPIGSRHSDGGCALKMCTVAAGKADLYIHTSFHLSKWDSCASHVILEEAGGKITDVEGNQLEYRKPGVEWEKSIVASNGKFHSEVISAAKMFLTKM